MNQKNRITNSAQETGNKPHGLCCKAEIGCDLCSSSLTNRTLFAVLFLFGAGLITGCVGPGSATCSRCSARPATSYSSPCSDFRGQTPCQTCPTSTVSQYSGGIYRNSITVSCCSPTALWEAMVIPVRKYFVIKSEKPCQQIGCCIDQGRLDTERTIGSTIFEPWRGDTVGMRQRWESTLHTIARRAEIRVNHLDNNTYKIIVVVKKEIENTSRINMSRNGQEDYFLSDSRRTFNAPLYTSENASSEQWVEIGQDPLLEQRLLAEIEQSIRARCR